MKLFNYLATFSVSLLLLIGIAFGQTPGTGAISGIVYDPAGRVVQNAGILVVNEATHAATSESPPKVPSDAPPGQCGRNEIGSRGFKSQALQPRSGKTPLERRTPCKKDNQTSFSVGSMR